MRGLNYTLNHGKAVTFYPLLEQNGRFRNNVRTDISKQLAFHDEN